MPNFELNITPEDGLVIGDRHDVVITLTLTQDPTKIATKAWLTVKRKVSDDDTEAVVQKIITTIDVADQGLITEDNSGGGGVIGLTFRLQEDETRAIGPRKLPYDIQVLYSGGIPNTAIKGQIWGEADVTHDVV